MTVLPRLIVGAFAFGLGALAAAAQAADYKALTALLVGLPGWEASEASGMNMEVSGQKMVSAERSYDKADSKHVQAAVIVGQMALSAAPGDGSGHMKVETADGILEVVTVDGFTVTKQHDKADGDSGSVIVHLSPVAMFAVTYEGLSAGEGLAVAQKFDWKKLQSAVK